MRQDFLPFSLPSIGEVENLVLSLVEVKKAAPPGPRFQSVPPEFHRELGTFYEGPGSPGLTIPLSDQYYTSIVELCQIDRSASRLIRLANWTGNLESLSSLALLWWT